MANDYLLKEDSGYLLQETSDKIILDTGFPSAGSSVSIGDSIGIQISKKGFDVRNSPQEQLILSGKYPLFKVFKEDDSSVTLYANDMTASRVITHNLGYIPIVLVYGQIAAGSTKRYFITGRNPGLESGVDEVFMSVDITTTTFTVTVEAGSPYDTDKVYNFHYYIMYDEVN